LGGATKDPPVAIDDPRFEGWETVSTFEDLSTFEDHSTWSGIPAPTRPTG
jgi:hypothetical protein